MKAILNNGLISLILIQINFVHGENTVKTKITDSHGSLANALTPVPLTSKGDSEEQQNELRKQRDNKIFVREVERRLTPEPCLNDLNFTVDNVDIQTCAWLRTAENRDNLCKDADVVMNCPESCGCCCDDNDSMTFLQFINSANQECSWLTEGPKNIRRDTYCKMTQGARHPYFNHGSDQPAEFTSTPLLGDLMLQDYCPKSCDICPIKLPGTTCPSSSPSSIPTLSTLPSAIPTLSLLNVFYLFLILFCMKLISFKFTKR